ncbi:MAG TPA: DUF1559 domain-containing protein, partial [Pirellulales bacterium]|nr:DUF1559 domain-containing protein [Pirellulales bacterium]
VYSLGATDAFCPAGEKIAQSERGAFVPNHATSISEVRDGTSSTIALGEGAGGARWPFPAAHR